MSDPSRRILTAPFPPAERRGLQVRLPAVEELLSFCDGCLADHPVRLTLRQLEVARPVFGDAIAYERVRIVVGWIANAPTTLGNLIRVSLRTTLDDATLIHELTHVWQYQTRGTSYISNSLCAQVASYLASGTRSGAYQLSDAELRDTKSIFELSAEKQAVFVQMYYADAQMRRNPQAQALMEQLRSTRPLPWSFFQNEPLRNALEDLAAGSRAPTIVPFLRLEF